MILKIWDDRPYGEGWIFVDHIKAIKHEHNGKWCFAKTKFDEKGASIYEAEFDEEEKKTVINRAVTFHPANGAFGSWMFSGTRDSESFGENDFGIVRIITAVFESEGDQSFILKEDHPSTYLLSDSGKTIERL